MYFIRSRNNGGPDDGFGFKNTESVVGSLWETSKVKNISTSDRGSGHWVQKTDLCLRTARLWLISAAQGWMKYWGEAYCNRGEPQGYSVPQNCTVKPQISYTFVPRCLCGPPLWFLLFSPLSYLYHFPNTSFSPLGCMAHSSQATPLLFVYILFCLLLYAHVSGSFLDDVTLFRLPFLS